MNALDRGLAERLEDHRAELVVHCYRMTGGYSEAEDLVQETFARALRAADAFEGRAAVRTWLYRIATNLCRDLLRARARHRTLPFAAMDPVGGDSFPSVVDQPWVEPIPDRVLDAVPEDAAVTRETIELAFVAAIQELPARQRAAFIVRDVLGWSTEDAAVVSDVTPGALKSALQRARANLRASLSTDREGWTTTSVSPDEQFVLDRYLHAHASGTVDELAEVLRDDLRVAYPQIPMWVDERDVFIAGSHEQPRPGTTGSSRSAPTASRDWPSTTGRQMPRASRWSRWSCSPSRMD